MNARRFLVAALALLAPLAALAPAHAAATAATPSPDPRVRHEVRVVTPDARHGAVLLDRGLRGYLGVDTLDLTPELRHHFAADEKAGLLVSRVEPASPAEHAGLQVGDVLLAVEGKPLAEEWDLRRVLAPHQAGDGVTLDLVREGHRQQLHAALEQREGHVLEVGHLMKGLDGDGFAVLLPSDADWARFGQQMGQMGDQIRADVATAFADPQVRQRIREHVQDRDELRKRIDTLEKRLRDLEKRLQEQQRR
jgi:membrane-associated protease RseP (regulator of RpoE activity)